VPHKGIPGYAHNGRDDVTDASEFLESRDDRDDVTVVTT
jgi:hypothetical protein